MQSIHEALSAPAFRELAPLYDVAEGANEAEKLEHLFVTKDQADEKDIQLMSIHKAKGLGAEHVFMIGLTEGILPSQKKGTDSIESQRRLFYVGMTRAKKALYLLCSVAILGKNANRVNKSDFKFNRQTRMWDGRASRFVEELGL